MQRNLEIRNKVRLLDKEIRHFFHACKSKKVRRNIIPGNTGSLWKAVKVANDADSNQLPSSMYLKGKEIQSNSLHDHIAQSFDKKIKDIISTLSVDDSIYNGKRMIIPQNKFFMGPAAILKCLTDLKGKNSEGYDRIPQRILCDGAEILV